VIVLVIGLFLVGGAKVVGGAAVKAMSFANDNLRKALCIFLKQFRQSGLDPGCYSLQMNWPRLY
jgi:hypothetical protein